MVISSPVWGLRPLPPARVATTKTPKPVRRTSSPALREDAIRSNTPSTALAASFLARPVWSASFWIRSFLFTSGSFCRDSSPSRQDSRGAGEPPARRKTPDSWEFLAFLTQKKGPEVNPGPDFWLLVCDQRVRIAFFQGGTGHHG